MNAPIAMTNDVHHASSTLDRGAVMSNQPKLIELLRDIQRTCARS